MRPILFLLLPLLGVSCATQRPVAVQTPPPVVLPAASPTKFVETRYDVRGYRESGSPDVRHEAHAVYRRTQVPENADRNFETVPRSAFAPASAAPLPASEELAAELATQKAITSDMRAMQTKMAETERQMQAQYGQLVRQSGEALKLREQLEAERNRARVANASPPAGTPTSVGAEAKW